jgi:two-component system KDP operon response regulator KdpE
METRKKILLVDDEEAILRFLSIKLKISGYDVVTTPVGREALELAKTESPDIMLLDIRLPDIDGFQVLHELRKFSKLPVIAYSATPKYKERALESGAELFMAKPFDTEQLVEKIHQLSNHRR